MRSIPTIPTYPKTKSLYDPFHCHLHLGLCGLDYQHPEPIQQMTCTTTALRTDILSGLKSAAIGQIEQARINVEVYLHNPVGIGEHPDVMAAIQSQLDIIADQEERISIVDRYFLSHTHKKIEVPN